MEVSYSRRLDYQYMLIDAGENESSDYRLSMLMNNRISGFLPVYHQKVNGRSILSYDITSLESLLGFFDAKKITYDEMVSLLLQLCSAVKEAGRYLLDGEGILLAPEYIYIMKNMEKVRFCYYPYQKEPLYQSVNTLSRFLIDHIDYDDRKSLELAYGLFQESLKENLSIGGIVRCIQDKLDDAKKSAFLSEKEIGNIEIEKQKEADLQNKEDIVMEEVATEQLMIQQKEKAVDSVNIETDSIQKNKKRHIDMLVSAVIIISIVVLLGVVLFTAVKRLIKLEVISKNIVAAALVVAVVMIFCTSLAVYHMITSIS